MIDLRSDTLTLPDPNMLNSILNAKLGDDGRTNIDGRGEDETVNALEDFAAELTGKDGAILFPTGTMGNTTAIFSHCKPKDEVLVDELQHILVSEKVAFDESVGQLKPVTYKLNENKTPDLENLKRLMVEGNIKLLCIENSHNFSGGMCIPIEELKEIHNLARQFNIPIHMDGARLFNACKFLEVEAKEICQYVDSVMFCISKGLGAPVGSLLCGNEKFIKMARNKRKLLGGTMRQAGIIAAPGIYALQNNIERLKEDNDNAKLVAERLINLKKVKIQQNVQTNIVTLDTSETGISPEKFCSLAKEKGLLIKPILVDMVRLVFYKGINKNDAIKVSEIIKVIDSEL